MIELRKPSRHYFLASDNTLQIHCNSCDSKRRDSQETLWMWHHHYKLLKKNFLHWIWNLFTSLGLGSCLKGKYAVSLRISVRTNKQIMKKNIIGNIMIPLVQAYKILAIVCKMNFHNCHPHRNFLQCSSSHVWGKIKSVEQPDNALLLCLYSQGYQSLNETIRTNSCFIPPASRLYYWISLY